MIRSLEEKKETKEERKKERKRERVKTRRIGKIFVIRVSKKW